MQPRRGSAGENLNNAVLHANKAVKSFGSYLTTSINQAASNVQNSNLNVSSPQKTFGNLFNPSSSMNSNGSDDVVGNRMRKNDLEKRRLFHKDSDFFENDADDVLEVLESERYNPLSETWSHLHLTAADPKR